MQQISTFLWFDNKAEEAARFYISLFKNSRIVTVSRYGEGAPMPAGTVMSVVFELNGQEFMALNGGPVFQFNEAISLFVKCESQEEIDRLWEKLTDGGQEVQCGWLKDRFGLSWQIVPASLGEMLQSKERERSNRVMQALLEMRKLDLAKLKKAFDGN